MLTWKELDEVKSITQQIGLKGAREFFRAMIREMQKPKATSIRVSTILAILQDANKLSGHMRLLEKEHDEPFEVEPIPVGVVNSITDPLIMIKFKEVFIEDDYILSPRYPKDDDTPF